MNWNFALILFVLLVVTGLIYGLDYFWLRRLRAARVEAALASARPSWVGLSQEYAMAQEAALRATHGKINWLV